MALKGVEFEVSAGREEKREGGVYQAEAERMSRKGWCCLVPMAPERGRQ